MLEEELIVVEQTAFRSGRKLAEGMSTFIAFIDLQKALDCVNRDLLFNKILANGPSY